MSYLSSTYIISKIDNNVDMICFLLTCKRLYHSIRLQSYKNIRFKGLTCFDHEWSDTGLNESVVRLSNCIPSFKEIVQNTLSHLVIRGKTFSKCKGLSNFYILESININDGDNNDNNSNHSDSDNDNNSENDNDDNNSFDGSKSKDDGDDDDSNISDSDKYNGQEMNQVQDTTKPNIT
ncbi:hypothetical protein DFA_10253 [Cavenderia fasciculata]|uniref:Uncharacterized protein n=1 Tax=Cavenderia fasciculata TaxID=261658 RepID=F4Q9P9_CACFS|nr:uncharacterized protein DFA_10253 [Cavenderia fasciculata]EGG15418.1 hypothetical protein DFA_10253 [Cavenderia fasciculata]|eukprot:XP_004354160.1 hypothetical protein DFA_10253 [Cavenderia fasciculata]